MRPQELIAAALLVLASFPAAPATAQDAESSVYAAAKTCTGLNSYLKTYPTGRYKVEAEERVAKECASASKPAKQAAEKAAAPSGDPCVQARADWAIISNSDQLPVLKAFVSNTPNACAVQKAQAQVRVDGLEAAAAKAASHHNELAAVLEKFVGTWGKDSGGCTSPWRMSRDGDQLVLKLANGNTSVWEVQNDVPPILKYNNSGNTYTMTLLADGRVQYTDPAGDSPSQCFFRK